MNDCIERKKAIELIQPHVKPQTVYGKGYLQAIEHATDILELMPAADVQPVKHGRWEYIRNVKLSGTIKLCECNQCHNKIFGGLNYCGNCGAKMDGEQDD